MGVKGKDYGLGSLAGQVGALLPEDDPKLVADRAATMAHLDRWAGADTGRDEDRARLIEMISLQDYV